jgi:putative transcriptional regulator
MAKRRLSFICMRSLKGHFLIAAATLTDPNFSSSVVLLVQHNSDGAMGVVLNRPMEVTVRQACEDALGTDCQVEGPLHQGGPCEALLVAVHTDPSAAETEVLPGLYFTTTKDRVEKLLEFPASEMRFFVGYAGWGPEQLEAELEAGSWLVAPADVQRVFASTDTLWTRLNTETKLTAWVDAKLIPNDPSVN